MGCPKSDQESWEIKVKAAEIGVVKEEELVQLPRGANTRPEPRWMGD